MKKVGIIFTLLITLILIGCSPSVDVITEDIVPEKDMVEDTVSDVITVSRVIDGDTLELSTGDKVRLICIDTPERGEELYDEATDKLESLVLNKEVILESDVTDKDRYGRILRYIYVDGTSVNREMVSSGFARVYRYKPDVKYCDDYEVAENKAKELKLNLWIVTEESTSEVVPDNDDIICSSNYYNCGDFKTRAEAQKVLDACGSDIHKLDQDGDGIPCESLS